MSEPTNSQCAIIAGPCSIDEHNINEVMQISEMEVKNRQGKIHRAIAGTRIVGLKSRTELAPDGSGMGMDYRAVRNNVHILTNGGNVHDLEIPPSVIIAQSIYNKTGMLIATEIMMPAAQMPAYESRIPMGKLMPWNPAVNQLGWQLMEIALFAKKNGWHIGIKNGKWIGETMEKAWAGLTNYARGINGDIILIHRGVDTPDKGDYRSLPVHQSAQRTKKKTGAKLYFDPSHSYGPKMRDEIVEAVIAAMEMKISESEYLYDGVLVEAGTSKTDTEQHITLKELETMVKKLASFRDLVSPNKPMEYTTNERGKDIIYQLSTSDSL